MKTGGSRSGRKTLRWGTILLLIGTLLMVMPAITVSESIAPTLSSPLGAAVESHVNAELAAARASLEATPSSVPRECPDAPCDHGTGDRWGGGLVYDARDGYVLLFGGYGPSGVLGDTWEFNGTNWTELHPAISPSPRQFPAMAFDAADNYVVLFGGTRSSGAPFHLLSDTWTFAGGVWTKLSPTTHPPASWQSSMAYDAQDAHVLLFGGLGDGVNFDQTWTFKAGEWARLTPTVHPSARSLASLAYDTNDSAMVLFGGTTVDNKLLSDTWTFSGTTWTKLSSKVHPSARFGAAFACPTGPDCVLFGGYSASGASSQTWKFTAGTWALNKSAVHPLARVYAMMTTNGSSTVFLFGGDSAAEVALGDTWYQSVATGDWIMLVFSTLTFTSPNAQTDGNFGNSVAVSTAAVVVGAPLETASGFSEAGHAYLINTLTGAVTVLTSPNAQFEGIFGTSVAISGTMAVIGAPGETASGLGGAGHAYMFNVTTGDLVLTLSSPNAQTDGSFGTSVAVSATTVVVGAPQETVGQGYAGHAYTFSAKTGDPLATLTSPNEQAYGYFGASVAISGTTIAVGADQETAAGLSYAGHAYLISTTTGDVTTLTSPNAQYNGGFGWSVAISGTTAVVGADDEETATGVVEAGHAYTFNVTTGDAVATLTSPDPQTGGHFGYSVAIDGTTAIVGAPIEWVSGAAYAGRAYSFDTTTGDALMSLASPDPQLGGNFGESVAIYGTTIVVGAFDEAASGYAEAGHAYIYADLYVS